MKNTPKDRLRDILDEILDRCDHNPERFILISNDINLLAKDFIEITNKIEQQINSIGLSNLHCIGLRFEDPLKHILFHFVCLKLNISVININPMDVLVSQEKDFALCPISCLFHDVKENYFHQEISLYVDHFFTFQNDAVSIKLIKEKIFNNRFAFIFSGSGTTGNPKIIGITRESLAAQIHRDKQVCNFVEGENYFTMTNLYFNTPKRRILAALYSGLSVVLPQNKSFDFINFCIKFNIHHIALTTNQVRILLNSLKGLPDQPILSNLKSMIVSGSPLLPNMIHKIEKYLTKNLFVGYGCNECGELTIANPSDIKNNITTVGKVLENVIIKIIDDNGIECEANRIGRIAVQAKDMIKEYPHNEVETLKSFNDGWFFPGDLGVLNESGYLNLKGRNDDMMIFTGVNIYPIEIEIVLENHPNVVEAAVFPIKIDGLGDVPYAAVVINESIEKKLLLQWCEDNLGWKKPREILILSDLPKNRQGKVMKKELQKIVIENLNRMNTNDNQRQVVKKYTYNRITIPEQLNFRHIDSWLKQAFEIEIHDTSNEPIKAVVVRILQIVKELFQGAKIPVYFKGEILDIKQNSIDKTSYTVQIAIGHFDLMDEKIYIDILNTAHNIFFWMLSSDINPNNKQQLHQKCIEFLTPIIKVMPYGESRIPVLKVAYERGIPFLHLGSGIYQLGWGNSSKIMDRSSTGMDSMIGGKISENKIASANLFRLAGIPAPKHGVAKNINEAKKIVSELGFPVVVKPINLNGGVGVTTDVDNEQKLESAFQEAQKVSKEGDIIIERQVEGICHRLFIAENRLLYAVIRHPIGVQGNGQETISTLIQKKNQIEMLKIPWRRSKFLPYDDAVLEELKKNGFTFESIPTENEWVPLRNIESTMWGGRDEDVTKIVHPANLDIAIRAVSLLGLEVAGVDIITNDVAKPWYETGAILNEVNLAPTFGVGEISNRQLPSFFDLFIEGEGRIPIDVFVGSTKETLLEAKKRQEEYILSGSRCYLTKYNATYDDKYEIFYLDSKYITYRIKALLINKNVDALVIVVENDELLHTVLPFDKVSSLTVVSSKVESYLEQTEKITKTEFDRLVNSFITY